jgi:hypothetical protein
MSSLMSAPPLPKPVHEYAYLQPYEHGADKMVLVRCADFAVPPFSSWFFVVLVKDPAPRPFRVLDGVPVFTVPAPRDVMIELLECAKKEARALRAMEAVPAALAPMDLPTWVEYLEQFSLAVIDHTPLPEGPPEKRARTHAWFPTAEELRSRGADDSVARAHPARSFCSHYIVC